MTSRDFLRVCTFNMQFGTPASTVSGLLAMQRRRVLKNLAAELASLDADVILLQEVDDSRLRSGYRSQADKLASYLGMEHYFVPIERSVRGLSLSQLLPWRKRGAYGLAILSRHPMRGCVEQRLPERVSLFRRSKDRSRGIRGWRLHLTEPRVCAYTVLEHERFGEVILGVTHLSTLNTAGVKQLSKALDGFEELRERNALSGARAVLGGDFNMAPASVNQVLRSQKHTNHAFAPLAKGFTFPQVEPRVQIDHILGSGFCEIRSRAVSLTVSDHCALVADIS